MRPKAVAKWRISLPLIGLLLAIGLSTVAPPRASAGQPVSAARARYDTLNITFAIDTSGSMDTALNATNWNAVDAGVRLEQKFSGASEFPPTDPDNKRFEMVEFMMKFLADFTQTQRGRDLSIWTRVIGFDSVVRADLPGWESWQLLSASNAIDLKPPSLPPTDRHSDFASLFSAIKSLQSSAPGESPGTKNVVFIVTDSTPCADPANNQYCASINWAREHLEQVRSQRVPSGVEFHLVTITGRDDQTYRALDQTWAQILGSDVLHYIETVNELPGTLMDALGLVLYDTLGARPGMDDEPSEEEHTISPQQALERVGIFEITKREFSIPPYVSSMKLTTFSQDVTPPDTTQLEPAAGGGPPQILPYYATADMALASYGIVTPPPGTWEVNQFLRNNRMRAWLMFYPAVGRLSVEPAADGELLQYDTIRVRYEVLDENGVVIPPQFGFMPHFNITVANSRMEGFSFENMQPLGGAFVGEFLALEDGRYDISAEVTSAPNWDQRMDYAYLSPADTVSISAIPVTWVAEMTGGDAVYQPGQTIRGFPRGLPMMLEVYAQAGGDRIAWPQGADVRLTFGVPESVTDGKVSCPEQREVPPGQWQNTTTQSRQYTTIFPQTGRCDASLLVTMNRSLLPFGTETFREPRVEYDTTAMPWQVQVAHTTLITVRLVGPDGMELAPQNAQAGAPDSQTTYRMLNRIWPPILFEGDNPLRWEPDSVMVEVVFRDAETNAPVDPVPSEPIPLRVSLERDLDDRATPEMQFTKSVQAGYYAAVFSDLEAGTYNLTVELLPDQPTLDERVNTYDASLQALIERNANPTFRAILEVEENRRAVWLEYGLLTVTLLSVALVVLRSGRFIWNTAAPLSGDLVIYKQGKDGAGPREVVWRKSLPSRRNHHTFSASELPLAYPGVDSLKARTRRSFPVSRSKGAYVTLTVNGDVKVHGLVKSGQWPSTPFFRDVQGTLFFLGKDVDIEKMPDAK